MNLKNEQGIAGMRFSISETAECGDVTKYRLTDLRASPLELGSAEGSAVFQGTVTLT